MSPKQAAAKTRGQASKPLLKEVVDRKEEIRSRLKVAAARIHRCEIDANRKRRDAADWKVRLDSQVQRYPGDGHPESRLKEIENLREKAEGFREIAEAAQKQHDELVKEQADLKEELGTLEFRAPVEEVLEYQEVLAEAIDKVASLKSKVAKLAATIEEGNPAEKALSELRKERESLLADIELGDGSKDDLLELDYRFEETEEKAAKRNAAIIQAKETITGFTRKIQQAEKELEVIRKQTPEILQQFLMNEAESVYDEYVKHCLEVEEKYRQLVGLNELLGKHVPASPPGGFVGYMHHRILMPAFNLKTRTVPPTDPSQVLFSAEGLNGPAVIETERERVRRMGVTIV